jgi:hypothetical protein
MKESLLAKPAAEFTSNELWFLFKQFNPVQILGIMNPHLGWLVEEIEQADQDALNQLVKRGLVKIEFENTFEINEPLHKLIKTIVNPSHSLIVQQGTPLSKPPQQYIHFCEENIVSHIEEEAGKHLIMTIRDQDALLEYLGLNGINTGKDKPTGNPFNIEEEILYKAAEEYAKGNNQAGEDILNKSCMKKEDIRSLHEALSNTLMNRSFAAVKNQDKPDKTNVTGFGILQGESNLWILQPVNQLGKSIIHFVPANTQTITEKLKDILPSDL